MVYDIVNQMVDAIKTTIEKGASAGKIADGNIPVKKVIDSNKFELMNRQSLPLIQFDWVPAGNTKYIGMGTKVVPFGFKFIVWVDIGVKPDAAIKRSRIMRENLEAYFKKNWDDCFGQFGIPIENVRFSYTEDDNQSAYAIATTVTISGEAIYTEPDI